MVIEVEGPLDALARFAAALVAERPPLSTFDSVTTRALMSTGESTFHIDVSGAAVGRRTSIPPDVATCDACRTYVKVVDSSLLTAMTPDLADLASAAELLLDEGVFVTGFGFPVVPQGEARVRCQVSAAHTREDLDQALQAFEKVGRRLGLL